MIHFMTAQYVHSIESGTRKLEDVPEFDKKKNEVRKCVLAALVATKIQKKLITFSEVCGEGSAKDDEYFAIAKDDTGLKDLITEYAATQKITL